MVPVYNERETLQQFESAADAAAGDAVALMDANLQDPPELLEEFIKQPPLSARRLHPMDAMCSGKIHARAAISMTPGPDDTRPGFRC